MHGGEARMELVALAKNPAPSGATTGIFKSPRRGAAALRALGADAAARIAARCASSRAAASSSRNISRSLPICAGAASPWPPWTGAARAARAARCSIPRKGYVRSFAEYDQDLAHFMREIVLPDCQPPYIALAHSMGGHILLRNATLPGSWFSRMVLSAPMIAIAEARLGAPRAVSRALRRDPRRPRPRLHVRARRPRPADRARALRGQSAHLRPRALSAQPPGAARRRRRSASARRRSPGCARRCARSPGSPRRTTRSGWRCRCCCSPPAWTPSSRRRRSRSSRCA